MSVLSHLRSRRWVMLLVLIGLVVGHAMLLYRLRHAGMSHAGVSGAVLSGVILLVVAKHLGLFAALLRPIHGLFRRRFRSGRPEN
jgi:hypothetical protein